jgi:predicted NAD-dependent protein-ADP-ribosyltransferase YbiA (DUF1768 family)
LAQFNITSDSEDERSQMLSNFSAHRFVLSGLPYASVEGFIQGIKFPPDDPARREAFQESGMAAKRIGRKAKRVYIWWGGQVIPYGSPAHVALIERAIRAKFKQNPETLTALIATGDMELVHDTGYPESAKTSLPAATFCDILTRIRHEANSQPTSS